MKYFLITLSLVMSAFSHAEIAVIVHPSNSNDIDKTTITKIYMGKTKSFPNGEQAVPINQIESQLTDEFNNTVLSKSTSQLRAYWSKLIFTGKGSPPKEVNDDKEVLELVASNPNLIGYVDSSLVDDSVKVIGRF